MASRNISRYSTRTGIEGQYQPGSHHRVLANLLGLTSKRAMDRAEYHALLTVQEQYLSIITKQTAFSADLICRMHRDWLGGIYAWAGRYRTVELAKSGFRWPPAYLVAQNMTAFEQQMLRECTPCLPGSLDQIATALARVQADMLLIHPFREGNGRMARWLTDLMALQAGLPALNYGFTGTGSSTRRRQYLAAVIAGYARDYQPLARFLAEALARALAAPASNPRAPSKRLESKALRRNIARRRRRPAR